LDNTPLVTVLIPTYNCATYIRTAIDSALAQTYPAVEIIVIDDGSTDETQAILQSYKDKIHIIKQSNQGAATARNAGLAIAQGEYIATLDADDSWLPERLEKMVKFMQNSPCDIVLTNFYLVNEANQYIKIYFNPNFSPPKKQYQALLRTPLPFVMMLARTKLIKALNYDETLVIAEDYDLYLRALQNGACWGYLSEPLANYRMRVNSLSHSYDKNYKYYLWRIFNKHRANLGKYKTFLIYYYHISLYRWYLLDSALKSRQLTRILKQTFIALQSPWFIILASKVIIKRLTQRNYAR
jgi:glycosyltransferase involved in cell wall biosynthesis